MGRGGRSHSLFKNHMHIVFELRTFSIKFWKWLVEVEAGDIACCSPPLLSPCVLFPFSTPFGMNPLHTYINIGHFPSCEAGTYRKQEEGTPSFFFPGFLCSFHLLLRLHPLFFFFNFNLIDPLLRHQICEFANFRFM